MSDPMMLLRELNAGTTDEIALGAPERLKAPPVPMGGSKPPAPRRYRGRVLGAALIGAALVGVGGTAVAISNATDADPQFTDSGPLVTGRIAPSDARWANPGEPELNLQSPLIRNVFRQETRDIPLPPRMAYGQVYGNWIRDLTGPGTTQHTRTEIRAEALQEALLSWFRYWLSATPAQQSESVSAIEGIITSPDFDRTLGEPTGDPDSARVGGALAAAQAGDPGPMREWISERSRW